MGYLSFDSQSAVAVFHCWSEIGLPYCILSLIVAMPFVPRFRDSCRVHSFCHNCRGRHCRAASIHIAQDRSCRDSLSHNRCWGCCCIAQDRSCRDSLGHNCSQGRNCRAASTRTCHFRTVSDTLSSLAHPDIVEGHLGTSFLHRGENKGVVGVVLGLVHNYSIERMFQIRLKLAGA